MEVPSKKMEEIYSIPIKYIESWLDMKESKGFVEYWVVLKTHYMFFFKDQNTHCKEQYVGYLNIEVGETKCTSKKRSDFMVEIAKKKKFLFRATDDILRRRWIYALELVGRAEPPGPLPGDLDFKMPTTVTPGPSKMKARANSIAVINYRPASPEFSKSAFHRSSVVSLPDRGSLSLQLEKKLTIEEDEEEKYDNVFIPPSWYFDNLSRNEAMQLLDCQKIGTYLLRNTESSKIADHYTLSIKDIDRIKHHKINPLPKGCYFEGASNAPFHNPVEAVTYLMQTKYNMVNPQPIQGNEARFSGDGQEDSSGIKRESNDYYGSPVTPSFGGHFPISPSKKTNSWKSRPLLPSPPEIPQLHGPHSLPSPPNGVLPHFQSSVHNGQSHPPKIQTLPAKFSMSGRPLPELPFYENAAAIRKHRGIRDSYVDMSPNSHFDMVMSPNINNNDEDTPPPLPRKRSSNRNVRHNEPMYVNVPFPDNDSECHYERPVVHMEKSRDPRRLSQP